MLKGCTSETQKAIGFKPRLERFHLNKKINVGMSEIGLNYFVSNMKPIKLLVVDWVEQSVETAFLEYVELRFSR